MVNQSSINIPQGIDLSKLNIALELMWLRRLFNENYISEEQYKKLKLLINNKYL